MLRRILRTCADILLPQTCLLCAASGYDLLCPACRADLPWQGRACPRCALPSPLSLCGACLAAAPLFQRAQAVFTYTYPLDRLIVAGKFHHNLAALRLLGRLMAESLCASPADALIPVPLHPHALAVRGYNQAVMLARPLAQQFGIPLQMDACACVKRKLPQSRLSGSARWKNVHGAFEVRHVDPNWRKIILLDDVMTTGATLNELSKQFLHAGVAEVEVWCCARSIGHGWSDGLRRGSS
jgi:ComF family protein